MSPGVLELRRHWIGESQLSRRPASDGAGFDGDVGHGRTCRFETPEGHRMELFWDGDYFTASAGRETRLRNRPQKRPQIGVPIRRIDHLNLMVGHPRLLHARV
jgi:hypothetical protein